MFLHFYFPAVSQTASAIPKTWRKPNEGISAGDTPQKEDEVGKEAQEETGLNQLNLHRFKVLNYLKV